MGLRRITEPTDWPVWRYEVQDHLSLPYSPSDHDFLLERLIHTAESFTERHVRRAWTYQTWELTLSQFPSRGRVLLPRPPLVSVTSVTYVDTDGVNQTLAPERYLVDATDEPGVIVPAYGESWPEARCQPASVAIRYVAGYGETTEDVPQDARHAMLLLIAHWFENREAVFTGSISKEIELGVKALLDPFRVGIVPGGYDL